MHASYIAQGAKITHPRVDNDLLMLAASLRRSPSAPEDFCLQLDTGIQDHYWFINHDKKITN
jgi:hypothetical protein